MRGRPLRSLTTAALTGLLLAAAPAGAQTSPMELLADRPAATLLLPYFEVDLGSSGGSNTVFSVANASSAATLAHFTVWSDLAIPVLAFDTYLTGYDVLVVDMRRLLRGELPQTADAARDPADTVSPKGPYSEDKSFPGCDWALPLGPMDRPHVVHVQRALTGRASPIWGGLCAGYDHGDRRARGYVTVDAVGFCSLMVANSPGYFSGGGTGVATNENVLWGEFTLFDRAPSGAVEAHGGALVGVRADGADPETTVPGQYTFYGAQVAWSAIDNRQPLASTFAARYFGQKPFGSRTEIIAWRDTKEMTAPFPCGTAPPWFPLSQNQIVFFSESEDVMLQPPDKIYPIIPPPVLLPFSLATQKVRVGSRALLTPFRSGWIYFNLNTSTPSGQPAEYPPADQAWLHVTHGGRGLRTIGYPAAQLDSAARTEDAILTP